jgi:hypothetical protein
LEGVVQVYQALSKPCKHTKEEMALNMPVILDGYAMALYSSKQCKIIFKNIVQGLRDEFTSEEQRNRLLRVWKKASLRAANAQ